MQEQTAALSELSVERDGLLNKIEILEREHSGVVARLQEEVKLKEENMAAEISHLEISFKESEHMLKEDVEEKANIIQVSHKFVSTEDGLIVLRMNDCRHYLSFVFQEAR